MPQSPYRLRNVVKCVECDVKPYYTHTHYSIRPVMTLTSDLENLISNDFMLLATTGYICGTGSHITYTINLSSVHSKLQQYLPVVLQFLSRPTNGQILLSGSSRSLMITDKLKTVMCNGVTGSCRQCCHSPAVCRSRLTTDHKVGEKIPGVFFSRLFPEP